MTFLLIIFSFLSNDELKVATPWFFTPCVNVYRQIQSFMLFKRNTKKNSLCIITCVAERTHLILFSCGCCLGELFVYNSSTHSTSLIEQKNSACSIPSRNNKNIRKKSKSTKKTDRVY
jgi:hypothetical protein